MTVPRSTYGRWARKALRASGREGLSACNGARRPNGTTSQAHVHYAIMSSEKMLSIQQSVAKIFAGLTASVIFAPASWAVTLTINSQSVTVQTPTTAPSGIAYVQNGVDNSSLTVYTNGFLFCDNVYPDEQSPIDEVTLTPAHEDQGFAPAHRWAFSTAKDVRTVAFTGTSVLVNPALVTTLSCRGVGAFGEVASAVSEGIFDNGLESATSTNYANLINWIKPQGFNWNNPDWSQVPADPCNPTVGQPAEVEETVSCAAVSAARPAGASAPVRAATIWTATDGISFTYAFRVDNRFGEQIPGEAPNFQVPAADNVDAVDASTASKVSVLDAYDAAYLAAGAHYCLLAELPTVLNSSACSGSPATTIEGTLEYKFAVQPPPVGPGSSSFYVVVNRQIGQGSHPNLTTPVVGVAIVVDPVLVAEGGDQFIGDDVVFGFTPGATSGFPWMNGQ